MQILGPINDKIFWTTTAMGKKLKLQNSIQNCGVYYEVK